MTTNTESFEVAYDSYYKAIHAQLKTGAVVLEVGGGAHPSIGDRESISYTIVDPDETEINKAPAEIKTICSNIQDLKTNDKYDLIISKMVWTMNQNTEHIIKEQQVIPKVNCNILIN